MYNSDKCSRSRHHTEDRQGLQCFRSSRAPVWLTFRCSIGLDPFLVSIAYHNITHFLALCPGGCGQVQLGSSWSSATGPQCTSGPNVQICRISCSFPLDVKVGTNTHGQTDHFRCLDLPIPLLKDKIGTGHTLEVEAGIQWK